jgi:uncharacterized surface anchored protein
MRRRIWKLLGAAAIVGGVMAPTAALAQDYPTPSSSPTATTGPSSVEGASVRGAQVTRPSRRGSTLPFTGGEIAALTLVGLGVTGAGVVLVGFGRRRTQTQS